MTVSEVAAMRMWIVLGVVSGLLVTSVASADEPAVKKARAAQKVIVLDPTDIVGRWRPVVSVDVARQKLQMPLSRLKHPFADRIETAVQKEPY